LLDGCFASTANARFVIQSASGQVYFVSDFFQWVEDDHENRKRQVRMLLLMLCCRLCRRREHWRRDPFQLEETDAGSSSKRRRTSVTIPL